MKNWIQNRNLLTSLLTGGLVVTILLAAVWAGTAAYFLAQSDADAAVRAASDDISKQFLAARNTEKDFMLRDLREADIFAKGTSSNLLKFESAMASLSTASAALSDMASGDEKDLAARLPAALTAYGEAFRKQVAAYRDKGYKDWGVEGEWRKAIHDLEQRLPLFHDLALEVDMLQLRRNEKDYLLRGDTKYVDAVFAGLKRLAAKLGEQRGVAVAGEMREHLKSYEHAFRKYLTIQEQIGQNLETGLQGETEKAARAVDRLLEQISTQAVLDSASARHKLAVAGVLSMIVGIAVAAAFFYVFASAVAEPIKRLSEAAGLVGAGDLGIRMKFAADNELGALAAGFNKMLEALAALIGEVQKSGVQVNTSVMEISATAKEQQATASEVAATTSEIGATSKEISATSKELVKTVGEVATVAEQTATLAGHGQAGLSRMEETMQRVMEAAGSINTKLAVLSEKAGNINQVVTTITKVADQTNLLSLNAAIEAEKAGEYGRGFAVVATEIRRLADQTAVATYDIEQMVREIQSAVSAGVMGMDRFSEQVRHGMQEVQQAGQQLSQIIHQVQTLAPRFEAVNEGMQAQATGAEQISDALTQLSEASQQTVDSLRQSTEAISELNQVVSGLRSSVAHFKLHE